jgi:hypothetical protein
MTKPTLIVVAVALLLGASSLASAKSKGAAGAHNKPGPSVNDLTPRPSIVTPRKTGADPYYRLSDAYYGYSDPYRGLFDFFAVPSYTPGNAYRYVRPVGRP